MKIVRFNNGKNIQYGVLNGEIIQELKVGPFDSSWDKLKPVYTNNTFTLDSVRLLVPCEPTKYLGVGLNFHSAAAAMKKPCPTYPITFVKPTGAVIATGENIVLIPKENANYLYEGEMAVVIGKKAKGIPREEALEYVLGFTCSNDVTDFTYFGKDELRLKGADTFGPVGPCIETDLDPDNVVIRSWVNGVQRQEGNTNDMIFNASYMISFFSEYMTLFPGDIISLGTPAGIGNIQHGDKICVEVEGVGKLYNTVY